MNRFIYYSLLFWIPFSLNSQETKVLFLGNSYTFFNDLPLQFESLAIAGGFSVSVDWSTPGGCTLSNPSNGHLYTETSLEKINAEEWNYVILQEQSQYPVIPYWQANYFYTGAAELDSLIKSDGNCSQTMMFMTWGRRDGGMQCNGGHCSIDFVDFNHMTDSMASSYLGIGNALDIPVSPVGIAWKNALAEDETLPLFHNDGSHPSEEGTYLAACTFYAAIFHESPVGLDYYYTLPESTATFLQQIAASTVLDDLNKWNIDTTSIFVDFEYAQNEDTIDFINQTENADSYLWDFGDGTTDTTENPVHIYNSTGVFEAVLTAYKFCDSSSTSKLVKILIASDGNEIKSESSINIFPNPSNGIVTIKPINNRENYDLTISAMDGKIIFKENNFISDGNTRELDLSAFPPNLYIFKMSNKYGSVFKQIVLK